MKNTGGHILARVVLFNLFSLSNKATKQCKQGHTNYKILYHINAKGVIKVRKKVNHLTEAICQYCACVWYISWHEFNPIIPKRVRHVLITSSIIMMNNHE